ncbi:TetR/AcrR family transcriptional regulator [Roseomonas sp. 1311]|uniref:TetR/AcrR family transcriptional regulator n=1 Tax=Roseomonas marmotae TaxID=2768161 RepID=A0ABS3K9P3_9PROT|nr:TetR/AcrR family transcriptional regulator [Roseomonas marmotae]
MLLRNGIGIAYLRGRVIPTGSYQEYIPNGTESSRAFSVAQSHARESTVIKAPRTKARSPAAQRLCEVAKDLFYRQGIRATGVEELCRVAGTTKISLYRAFPSKDELVAAILREDCEEKTGLLEEVMSDAVPAQARPAAVLARAAASLRQSGFRGCPVGMAIVEFPDPEHPARKVADAYKQKTRERLCQICTEAGAADPRGLGDSILLLIEGAFSAAPYLGNDEAARMLERAGTAILHLALPAVKRAGIAVPA